jgi:hypothetical protein
VCSSDLTLQGSYTGVNPEDIRKLPIFRVTFSTSANERDYLLGKSQQLYEQSCAMNNYAYLLSFVEDSLNHHSDVVHDLLAYFARQMVAMNKQVLSEIRSFFNWLEYQVGMKLEDLNGKSNLQNLLGDYQKGEEHFSINELLTILVKNKRRMAIDPSERGFQQALAKRYQQSLDILLPIKQRLAMTDRLIDQIVYKLYGLTDEDIAVVEGRTNS